MGCHGWPIHDLKVAGLSQRWVLAGHSWDAVGVMVIMGEAMCVHSAGVGWGAMSLQTLNYVGRDLRAAEADRPHRQQKVGRGAAAGSPPTGSLLQLLAKP